MQQKQSDKALRYLGLALKAGQLVIGADECEKAIKKGQGKLLILASDAANNATRMAQRLSAERDLPLMRTVYTKSELATVLGRKSSVALALVKDESLAAAFAAAAPNGMEQEEQI